MLVRKLDALARAMNNDTDVQTRANGYRCLREILGGLGIDTTEHDREYEGLIIDYGNSGGLAA